MEASAPASTEVSAAPIPAMAAPAAPSPASPAPVAGLQAPKNWETQAPSTMRLASYLVKGEAGALADISLVILDGAAGNTLDNVNRWLGQLGQQPIAAEKLSTLAQKVTTALGEMAVVDLEGLAQGADASKDGKILAALATVKGETWFFKMRGNAALVTAEKAHFLDWVRSANPATRPESAFESPAVAPAPTSQTAMPAGHPPLGAPASASPGSMPAGHPSVGTPATVPTQAKLQWEIPKDWKTASASGMRYASFTDENATGDKADISVVNLPGQAGDDLSNVNRWRQQLGLAPVTEAELKPLVVHVSGEGSASILLVDLASADRRMLAGWTHQNDETWFFKCVGPSVFVEAGKEKFLGFLRSVKFDKNATNVDKVK